YQIKSFSKSADIHLLAACRVLRSTKMVFRYMVADTDLVKGKVPKPKPKNQNVKITKAPTPPKEKSLPLIKKKAKFCLLLLVNTALLFYLYNHFAPETFPRPWQNITLPGINTPKLDFLATNKLDVTGIMYYDENPAAIISGKVVHEGDVIQNCKVVKIHKNKVEFQKDGKSLTKHVSK
ncbi:MAG: hypothetical protein MUO22_02755, partial [Sedimentisphaerales bacterium]|nr:hypothetical protein [Sedimentisphaerales bacterium]